MGTPRFTVRWAAEADIPSLVEFFGKAYGENSVFCSPRYLRWYFGREGSGREMPRLNSLVAVDPSGCVVAHYGGIPFQMYVHGRTLPCVWGVNAFTLPEARGQGAGGELVKAMVDEFEVYGVIGFTEKTAQFYESVGFNLFGRRRFHRFVFGLSESVFDAAGMVGGGEKLREAGLRAPARARPSTERLADVAWLQTGEALRELRLDLDYGDLELTTCRTPEFLRWKYFDLMEGQYEMGVGKGAPSCPGYVIGRRERLFPSDLTATRIVDLFGTPASLESTLVSLRDRCRDRGDAYLEAALFGARFDALFEGLGFTCLEEEEAAWLPFVSCPVEPRENHEFLGLFSSRWAESLSVTRAENLLFTRGDSDRDRLSRTVQLGEDLGS